VSSLGRTLQPHGKADALLGSPWIVKKWIEFVRFPTSQTQADLTGETTHL